MRANLNLDKFLAIYITISLHRSQRRVAREGVVFVRFLERFVRRDGSANAGRGPRKKRDDKEGGGGGIPSASF